MNTTPLHRRFAAGLLAAGLLFGVAACGDDDDATNVTDDGGADDASGAGDGAAGLGFADLSGATWTLTAGTHDDEAIEPIEGSDITLTFADGQVTGVSACNNYSGTATVEDGSVTVGPLASTEMACDKGDIMNLEVAYLAALSTVDTASLDGDTLTLTGTDVELVFARG